MILVVGQPEVCSTSWYCTNVVVGYHTIMQYNTPRSWWMICPFMQISRVRSSFVKQLRTLRYNRLPKVDDLHEAFTARKTNRNSHIYHQPHPAKAVEVAQLQIIK